MTATEHSSLDYLAVEMAQASERTGDIILRALRPAAQIELWIGPEDRAAFEHGMGVALPPEPNRWSLGAVNAFWLAPNEWLLIEVGAEPRDFANRAAAALDGLLGAVVDVSDQRVGFELSGARAREVLATGCPLDLHPRVFGPGDCAQSVIGKLSALLAQVDETPRFRVYARRSHADACAALLLDALAGLLPISRDHIPARLIGSDDDAPVRPTLTAEAP